MVQLTRLPNMLRALLLIVRCGKRTHLLGAGHVSLEPGIICCVYFDVVVADAGGDPSRRG